MVVTHFACGKMRYYREKSLCKMFESRPKNNDTYFLKIDESWVNPRQAMTASYGCLMGKLSISASS